MTAKKLGVLFFFLGSIYLVAQENIALNKPVTVDSERNDYYHKGKAVDGNNVDNETRWMSLETDWPHWIEVDFEGTYAVSQLKFWTGYNGYNDPVTYRFEIWNGSDWTTVVDGSDNTLAIVDESFTAVTTNKVRLFATGSTGNNFFKLYEIEVYGVPSDAPIGSGSGTENTNSDGTTVWASNGDNIYYEGGNVGIGTTNPNSTLEVNGTTIVSGELKEVGFQLSKNKILGLGNSNPDATQNFNWEIEEKGGTSASAAENSVINSIYDTNFNKRYTLSASDRGTSLSLIDHEGNTMFNLGEFYNPGTRSSPETRERPFLILPNAESKLVIGANQTEEGYSLTVNGKVHAKEVNIDLEGALAPDYVFYKDYDLRTLDEVQNHIDTKGHLPNIPSAAEMEKNGINLREMNLKLLEKIEELTLYTLAQEKELKKQKELNKKMDERFQKLEKLLSK